MVSCCCAGRYVGSRKIFSVFRGYDTPAPVNGTCYLHLTRVPSIAALLLPSVNSNIYASMVLVSLNLTQYINVSTRSISLYLDLNIIVLCILNFIYFSGIRHLVVRPF